MAQGNLRKQLEPIVYYGGAIAGGMAISGVVGYVVAAIFDVCSDRPVDAVKISTKVGLLGGWAVFVVIVYRLTGAA